MRRTCISFWALAAGLLGLAGCYLLDPEERIKRPQLVEEYVLPPDNESRFSNPIEYPANVLNKDQPKLYLEDGNGQQLNRMPRQMGGAGLGPGGPAN